MPTFYFNLYNDMVAIDEEGVELADVAAAEAQARTAAAQIIAELIAAGGQMNPDHRIEVEDGQRRLVLTLPFSDFVKRETGDD